MAMLQAESEPSMLSSVRCDGNVHGCDDSPTTKGLLNARTCAFVCVVWCENFRAYPLCRNY